MRALVTGGAGFIGSHLVDALLARKDHVVVLDDLSSGKVENLNPEARLVRGDVRERRLLDSLFESVRPAVCFHLAAQADVRESVEHPLFDASVNILGTIEVLEAARKHDAQVVFASTGGAIYGDSPYPATEDAVRRPLAPYGVSKLAGEEYLATYNRLYGGAHVALRLANVYGPRQDPHGEAGVVAIFLGKLLTGERPTIYGGEQTRDFVFVADVVRALLATVGAPSGAFNIATGVATTVIDLWKECREAAGQPSLQAEHAPPRKGELLESVLDPSLADFALGWRSEVELAAGIRLTWDALK